MKRKPDISLVIQYMCLSFLIGMMCLMSSLALVYVTRLDIYGMLKGQVLKVSFCGLVVGLIVTHVTGLWKNCYKNY